MDDAMMVVRHPQIWTVSFLIIGAFFLHTDPYRTLYKSNFEPEVTPRIFYHDGIPLLLPPSCSCLGIPDQIFCLEVQVGQITTRCHEIVILSAISTPNIPGIKIIFMLHAATYLGAFFALRFLGVFGFLNSNLYLPHFHWDVRELHHANLDSHYLYKN